MRRLAKAICKFKVTTDSNYKLLISPNLFGCNFTVTAANIALDTFVTSEKPLISMKYEKGS